MKRKKRWHFWWPTFAWAAVIFWFSSRPTITTSQLYWQDFIVKKTAHLTVYAILATLTYRSLKHTTKLDRMSRVIVTLALVSLYAISDEFHQSFVPGREPHLRDVIIDIVGASSAIWAIDSKGIIKL